MSLKVLFDNVRYKPGFITGWGFSCLVEIAEIKLLFDTGASWKILRSNFDSMIIDPGTVDLIVISHNHHDHTGGLWGLLSQKPGLKVYIPSSSFDQLGARIEEAGGEPVPVSDPVEIVQNVKSTGELTDRINEQSLIINSSEGPFLITGCAHPGIVKILKRANEVSETRVRTAMGGFHLKDKGVEEINNIADALKKEGLERVAPSHCSGEGAIKTMKRVFSYGFIESGVGKVIELELPNRQK